jgi:hypothetical protein
MRIEKCKSIANVASRAAHNLRENNAAPHANPAEKTHNKVLKGPSDRAAVVAEFERKISACSKFRKDAVRGIELVLTASPEFFDQKRPSIKTELSAWLQGARKWLRDTFGESNIVSEVLHADEKTPHLQVLVVPIHDGKLRAAHWLDGPKKLADLQTSYAKSVESGTRLRRGEEGSKANHTTLRDFYKLTQKLVKAVESMKPFEPPKLPERGILGSVKAEDWRKLQSDLERYGREGLRMSSEALVGRIMLNSSVGKEALLAEKRKREAEEAVAKLHAQADKLNVQIREKQRALGNIEDQKISAESELSKTLDRLKTTRSALLNIEARRDSLRPAETQVERETNRRKD